MKREPIIRPVPTEADFTAMVDDVIADDADESEIKSFIDIVLTVADFTDDKTSFLASAAARRAFTKSSAFENAFREFAGFPERPGYVAGRYTVNAAQEM